MTQIKLKLVTIMDQLYENLHFTLTLGQCTEPGCYHTEEFSKITSNLLGMNIKTFFL